MGNYYLHGKLLFTWEINIEQWIIIYMGNHYLHGKLLFTWEIIICTGTVMVHGFKKKKEHKVEEHETAILF